MDDNAAHLPGDPPAPRSVAELRATRLWTVVISKGWWVTAERTIDAGGRRWLIGLTPTASNATALILWSDDTVVDHARGTEAEMCVTASRWAANILAGRLWSAY